MSVGVIVSDTFGRTWRRGVTDVAIGIAGVAGIVDLRGTADATGRVLEATEVCVADELAGAAELVMGKDRGVPAAVLRGVDPGWLRPGSVAEEIVRPPGRGPLPLRSGPGRGTVRSRRALLPPGGRAERRSGRQPTQPTPWRSTTKTRVSLGAMTPPAPWAP